MSGEIIAYQMPNSSVADFRNKIAGGGSGHSDTWFVLNATTEIEAAQAVKTAAPATLLTLQGEKLVLGPLRVKRKTTDGGMEVDVNYVPEDSPQGEEPPEIGTWKFSFTTMGGTQKIMVSKGTRARYTRSESDEPAPDLFGGIGWDGKRMEGVDIYVGKFEFVIEPTYEAAAITFDFAAALADACSPACYNSAPWLGRPAGTLLFLGAEGAGDIPLLSGVRVKPITLKLHFAYSKNLTNFPVGSMIITEKLGWDYLWVYYRKVESEGKLYPVPYWAYVEQVYEGINFADLFGFGG